MYLDDFILGFHSELGYTDCYRVHHIGLPVTSVMLREL